jgi:hypothetical protein
MVNGWKVPSEIQNLRAKEYSPIHDVALAFTLHGYDAGTFRLDPWHICRHAGHRDTFGGSSFFQRSIR